jgi:hypothetical protein
VKTNKKAREELLKAIPQKYLAGLSGKERSERERELKRRKREGGSYEPLPSDAKAKTRPSKYSKTEFAEAVRKRMKTNTAEAFIRAAAHVSGISASIIRRVHERGAAAWSTGHRVGASQIAWSRARVYSFVTGGKTQKTADVDLWREHLDSKKG